MRGYTISERELQKYIHDKRVLLVDLREPQEYMQGHLPGAVNIPFEYAEKKEELWKNASYQMIVFYCERGNLSLRMARNCSDKGLRAMSLAGGISVYHGRLV